MDIAEAKVIIAKRLCLPSPEGFEALMTILQAEEDEVSQVLHSLQDGQTDKLLIANAKVVMLDVLRSHFEQYKQSIMEISKKP